MTKLTQLTAIIAVAGSVVFNPSFAYDGGDVVFRVGVANVQPDDSSDPLTLNGTELSNLGLGLPVTTLQVDDNAQLGLTITYMYSPNWGIEVLAATPFSHEISANALGVKAGETKHLPPTVSLQYYLAGAGSDVQPYFGIGLNYTTFFSEEIDSQLNGALAGLGATGNASLSLDDSFGLALEAGIDFKLNDNWVFNGALWYANIETSADITVPGLGKMATDVTIDPLVLMLSFGRLF